MPLRRRSGRPAWFPRLTLRGGIFLASGGALFLNALVIDRRDLLFVACLLIAVPVVAMIYVTVRPPKLEVTRTFRPSTVAAGGDTVVSLLIRNRSIRPVYGTRWRDTASPGIRVPSSTQLPALDRHQGGPAGASDTAILEYTIAPRHRGLYDVGPLMVGRFDPFGLAFSERVAGVPQELVVTPRVTPLPGSGDALIRGDGSMHELLRQINPNSDELIAREYRPGDPLRRVNWPATARHGEIMVRQEEQRSNPEALLILDTTLAGMVRSSIGRPGDRIDRHYQAFELAVEVAASVGVHLLDLDFRLQMIEFGASQLAPGEAQTRGGLHGDAPRWFRAPGGDRLLLEGLANLVPVERAHQEPGRGSSPRGTARGVGGQVPAFAVLVDVDDEDVTNLSALRRHCQPAIAFVVDTVAHRQVAALQDAGWHCVRVRTVRDIPDAWSRGQQERSALNDPV
jgi:hypothetical protein